MENETDTEVIMVLVVVEMAEVEAAVEVMGEGEEGAAEVMGEEEAVEVETEVNRVCLLTGPSQNKFKHLV